MRVLALIFASSLVWTTPARAQSAPVPVPGKCAFLDTSAQSLKPEVKQRLLAVHEGALQKYGNFPAVFADFKRSRDFLFVGIDAAAPGAARLCETFRAAITPEQIAQRHNDNLALEDVFSKLVQGADGNNCATYENESKISTDASVTLAHYMSAFYVNTIQVSDAIRKWHERALRALMHIRSSSRTTLPEGLRIILDHDVDTAEQELQNFFGDKSDNSVPSLQAKSADSPTGIHVQKGNFFAPIQDEALKQYETVKPAFEKFGNNEEALADRLSKCATAGQKSKP